MSSTSMFSKLPVGRFSRQMARLNLISSGPGSVTIPKNIESIEMLFKRDNRAGHMGAKKFWRENLPRVQFFNPDLPIQVTRVDVTKPSEHSNVPAFMQINYAGGESKKIDIKDKHSTEILKEFIEITKATPAEEIIIDRQPKSPI